MNFSELEYIVKIVQEGSLVKAAKKICITPPALSRIVSRVEKELEVEVFNREKLPWKLTPAGKIFLQKASSILEIKKNLHEEILKVKYKVKRKITIGIMAFQEESLVPNIIVPFCEKYNYIQVKVLTTTFMQSLEELILEDMVDFALVVLPVKYSNIEYIPVKSYKIVVALPLSHPLAKGYKLPKDGISFPSLNISLLKDTPFIMVVKGGFLHDIILGLCEQFNFVPSVFLELENLVLAHKLVSLGCGGAFILDKTGYHNNYSDSVAYFNIEGRSIEQEVAFAYKKGKKLSNEEQYFVQLLKEQ